MTEVKIFAIYSQFLGEFTTNYKDTYSLYSLAYSPMCESSIRKRFLNWSIFVSRWRKTCERSEFVTNSCKYSAFVANFKGMSIIFIRKHIRKHIRLCVRAALGRLFRYEPRKFPGPITWIVTFQVTIIFGLGFMSFCGGHFEFCWVDRLIGISPMIFWQPFWTEILDFGFQTSNFRSPHWAFALLNIYYICLSNRIAFRVPTHWLVSLLT